jgi:hypothetical protein
MVTVLVIEPGMVTVFAIECAAERATSSPSRPVHAWYEQECPEDENRRSGVVPSFTG